MSRMSGSPVHFLLDIHTYETKKKKNARRELVGGFGKLSRNDCMLHCCDRALTPRNQPLTENATMAI